MVVRQRDPRSDYEATMVAHLISDLQPVAHLISDRWDSSPCSCVTWDACCRALNIIIPMHLSLLRKPGPLLSTLLATFDSSDSFLPLSIWTWVDICSQSCRRLRSLLHDDPHTSSRLNFTNKIYTSRISKSSTHFSSTRANSCSQSVYVPYGTLPHT